MAGGPESSDWSDADDGDSERFAEYLAAATAVEQVQAYKARSFDRLAVDPGDSVLDAGCGIGDDAIALADRVGPDGTVIGVDNSVGLLEEASEKAAADSSAAFHLGDIADLDFDDDRFDASRTDRVLQHLEAPRQAIDELVRVTRPGGRVGLTDPDWESLIIQTGTHGEMHELLDPRYSEARNPSIGRELYGLANEVGLVDVEVDAFMLSSTSYDVVAGLGELERWLEGLEAADRGPEMSIERWLDTLRSASEEGHLLAAVSMYTVTGVVPS